MLQPDTKLARSLVVLLLLAGAATTLGGCCSLPLLGSCAVKDELQLSASSTLNDCGGRGSRPVTVRVYGLKGQDAFARADLETIWLQQKTALGADLVGVSERTLRPGDAMTLTLPRAAGTRYLGIVANFCDATPGCWRQVVTLPEKAVAAKVELAGTCMSLE
jgi:type VI secretion system VasD/TssJ family lipoprotein